MTENEAIEELKYDCNELGKAIPCDTSWGISFENAYRMAIQALDEVQRYREIGTVEECQEASGKQTPKKVKNSRERIPFEWYCPACGELLCDDGYKDTDIKYCDQCGQKLDWENT